MGSVLLRLLRIGIVLWIRYQRAQTKSEIQFQLAKAYLLGLQSLRRGVLLLFLLGAGILLVVISIASLFTGLLLSAPWELEVKAKILILLSSLSLLGAGFLVKFAFSERRWMKLFGVDRLFNYLFSDANTKN